MDFASLAAKSTSNEPEDRHRESVSEASIKYLKHGHVNCNICLTLHYIYILATLFTFLQSGSL